MKKHLIFCIALMALMTSCMKEPTILRRLTAEDAAAIPYQTGQRLNFMNENGDTLTFTVIYDETQPFSEDNWEYPDESKTSIIRQPWCYARTVQLQSHSGNTLNRMMFTIIPDKYLYFRWNNDMSLSHIDLNGIEETVEVNGVTYENVLVNHYYNTQNGELNYLWYYSEEVGLIYVKDKEQSLTLIP